MRRIQNILTNNWLLIIVLVIGVFLRFYRLTGFVTFLGDQGRDAIIIKRILTGEHFPAIGPPTSIGQIYLGPFYYYFIALWLLLFNFNPIGLVIGVAFFSSLYLLINYLIVKELFDKKVALISTILLSFSSVLIDFSRFSWNPNFLPLFTLLTIYFVIKSLKTNKWYYFVLSGAFLSFAIQLHYLALFLIPPIAILYLLSLRSLKQLISQSFNYLISASAFLFFSFPLIIFDLRHQFLNTKSFIALFQSSGTSSLTKFNSLFDSFYFLNLYSLNINLNKFLVYLLLFFLFLTFITIAKQKSHLKTFLLFFILIMLGMSLYNGPKHPHYFGILYPLYYVIISYFFAFPKQSVWEKFLTIFFVLGFIFLNFQKYPYFRNSPNNQIVLAKNVAQKIFDNVKKEKFTVTALPEKYSDSTYRYFLETWRKRVIEKDSLIKADELFVVCEKKCDPIIGNPQWDIAYFAPNKIIGEWKVSDVKIYKLIR
ncbi:glycosyltransferase family 39 protein [Candidatus Roizmanbacteria bacterium]|nr:glycosyltransferase family 39 protein [Candidatus Roizmanbacteria bacterium]